MINIEKIQQKYLGIPYQLHGRDFSGCDCWGLVIIFYKEELGITLLDLENKNFCADWYKKDNFFVENYYKQWREVEHPQNYDICFFKNYEGHVNHCGLILPNNIVMQTTQKHGVTFLPLHRLKSKIVGFYRLKQ